MIFQLFGAGRMSSNILASRCFKRKCFPVIWDARLLKIFMAYIANAAVSDVLSTRAILITLPSLLLWHNQLRAQSGTRHPTKLRSLPGAYCPLHVECGPKACCGIVNCEPSLGPRRPTKLCTAPLPECTLQVEF